MRVTPQDNSKKCKLFDSCCNSMASAHAHLIPVWIGFLQQLCMLHWGSFRFFGSMPTGHAYETTHGNSRHMSGAYMSMISDGICTNVNDSTVATV